MALLPPRGWFANPKSDETVKAKVASDEASLSRHLLELLPEFNMHSDIGLVHALLFLVILSLYFSCLPFNNVERETQECCIYGSCIGVIKGLLCHLCRHVKPVEQMKEIGAVGIYPVFKGLPIAAASL